MEYLFFDIECANCFHGRGKICSFGYVITDEKFNVITKNDILVNPHSKFHLCGHGNHPGITLGYDEKAFNSSPDFPKHYKKIRELLTKPNRLVFGFSVMSDAGYIKSECERFHKEIFDYDFIDIQRIFTDYKELDNTPSLIKCAHEYGVLETQDVHKSDDDSYFTMRVLKGICEETGLSALEIIEKYPHCKCWCKNGELGSEFLKYKEFLKAQKLSKMEKLTNSPRSNWMHTSLARADEFSSYQKRVFINKVTPSMLCGKKVCLSSLFEEYHFNEMMNIVSLLAKHGAKYTRHAYFCDIFVEYDITDKNGKEYRCYRKEKAQIINDTERELEFISLDALLDLLGTSIDKIATLDRSTLAPVRKSTKPFALKKKVSNT
jgi:inhibitor of KinA sporulation pathway (predicted exonuclease)